MEEAGDDLRERPGFWCEREAAITSSFVDIHPHIISSDENRYPTSPLFGERLDWSRDRAIDLDQLIAAMDEAGIGKAAVVHSSTTYGFDNSYVLDGCARYPHRLLAVGSVDMRQPDVARTIGGLVERGLGGLRVFAAAGADAFEPGKLDDPQVYPAWAACAEFGLPMSIYTGQVCLPEIAALADRFPQVPIILDNMARPDLSDGPPFDRAHDFFALARLPNIYLKLTTRTFSDINIGEASSESVLPRILAAYGADRIAWGSNIPTSPGTLSEALATARRHLSIFSENEQEQIFTGTSTILYPQLA